jgi:hypothetical protein
MSLDEYDTVSTKIDRKKSWIDIKSKIIYSREIKIKRQYYNYLSKYDNSHKNSEEAPKFKGNWDNQDDIDEYINNLSEYEESLDWIKYNGRYYTRAEMEEIELKDMLEKNGWNLRNCFVDKEAEKRLKKQRKEDKIKEKKIKDMLAAIHNRKEDREEKLGGLPQGINISEAKNKVKGSKKKKKKSKAEKKADKRMKIIFDADNDPEYKDKMEDFRWDL